MAKRNPLTTDKEVRALKAEAVAYENALDTGKGLRIKVLPSGRKTWFYRYRRPDTGKLEVVRLGHYPTMPLADARTEVERQRAIVREHGSAKQYLKADRAVKAAALAEQAAETERSDYTVTKLITGYLDAASGELKSWREVDRALRKYVLSAIGDTPVAELTRKDVIAVLEPLAKAGTHVQANRVLAYFRRACNWALENETIAANPCAGIKRYREQPKERFLSDTEIARFLKHLPGSGMRGDHADALRLILLTGMRPGEVVTLIAGAVDVEGRTVRLEDTKAGRSHTVPLGDQAFQIVSARKTEAEARQAAEIEQSDAPGPLWLFPNPDTQAGHLRTDALPGALKAAIPKLKVLPATPHDLRRSFATGLARIQAPRLLISLALNHAIPGITSVYDRHGYEAELRDWFEKWDKHVAALTGKNVTQLKAAR